jgi:glutathione S-transferase
MKPALHHAGQSTCSQKVRLALAEKGVDFESIELNLIAGDQHKPEYRRLNPNAVVPTLVHGDDVLIESTVINEYIDDAFDGLTLRPKAPGARARMRLWTKRLDDTVHPQIVVMSFCTAFRMNFVGGPPERLERFLAGMDESKRERMRMMVARGVEAPLFATAVTFYDELLGDMEATLQSSGWLAGDEFSLADIGYAPYLTRLDHLGLSEWWQDKPALSAWYSALRARPSYATAVDAWMPPPLLQMMAAQGEQAWPAVGRLIRS